MTPLTILQLTSSASRSGGTRQAMLLAKGLHDQGHRVVFCAPPGSPAEQWAAEAEVPSRPLAFGGLWGQWQASRRLRALAAEVGADLVHAHHTKGHNAAVLSTFGGPLPPAGGGFPPVIANRGVLFQPQFPAKFKSPRTTAIIANSRAVQGVLANAGVPTGKVFVVYNGRAVPDLGSVEPRLPRLRKELSLVGSGPVIGTVGRGRPEKGFQYLVEAAPRILERHPGAVFVLVGSGTEQLLPRIGVHGLHERFRLPGHRSDAVDIMGLFDVFVLPSIAMDSCPNVLLEAMGMGLPVVGSRVGGIGEILEDGATGRVVPPADPGAIAGAVADLLDDPTSARATGQRARDLLRERFTPEVKVRETLRVYAKVLGR